MLAFFVSLLQVFRSALHGRADLLLENLALRHQLTVLKRTARRPRLQRSDRMFWTWLLRTWPRWRQALVIVQPETVLAWHRAGYRAYWRWRSRGRPGRPRIPLAHIRFIRRISSDHPEWGEDRIALKLKLKLGVEHSTSTIRRYMVDTPRPPSDRWRNFLARHRAETWAIDFATIPLNTRQVVHIGVTAHPTLDWVKRRLKEAMPYGEGPRFLIHDGIFGRLGNGPFRSALDAWLHRVMRLQGVPIH